MELLQVAGSGTGALGIDAVGAEMIFHVLCGGVDGDQRVAGILPVDAQETAAVGRPAQEQLIDILRLGNEGHGAVFQRHHGHQRIHQRPMVADQQKLALRQLLLAGDLPSDAQNCQRIVNENQYLAVIKRRNILIFPVHRNHHADDPDKQQIEQIEKQISAQQHQQRPPTGVRKNQRCGSHQQRRNPQEI